MRYSEFLPFGLSNNLKLETKKIGSGGCTRGIVYQKWVQRKGVGELLDQCSQSNYNKNTGVKQWVNPNASYLVVNLTTRM